MQEQTIKEPFSSLFSKAMEGIPDYYEQVREISDLCKSELYTKEKVKANLEDIYKISRGTHPIFSVMNGPKILSRFKGFTLKATNLCIYKDNEENFV